MDGTFFSFLRAFSSSYTMTEPIEKKEKLMLHILPLSGLDQGGRLVGWVVGWGGKSRGGFCQPFVDFQKKKKRSMSPPPFVFVYLLGSLFASCCSLLLS